jgi:hypothetical protein
MPLTRIQSLGITDGTIVNADINASAAITLAKLSGVNDAKAWVNFNGTGTVAIRASFNVSSITDNGTGDYTVNYTNALTDAKYAIIALQRSNSQTAGYEDSSYLLTTSTRIFYFAGVSTPVDRDTCGLIVFR